ncbi:MAG: SpoIIIAC/SpoIIIAD family protein [Acutalibacteraceae bacterium]|nr:SpoIIIAC/SpoIIIAD family protein [Acutalibacteraceae bacterium]
MDIAKIAFFGIMTALIYALVRNIKPEIAPLVILGGVAVILITLAENLLEISGSINEMMELAGIEKENVSVLMKSLGICVVTQFAADICYDNSCSSIASAVELAGRLGAIALAMPLLQSVARLAIGLING